MKSKKLRVITLKTFYWISLILNQVFLIYITPICQKERKNIYIKELFDPKVKIEDGYKDSNKTLFKSENIQVDTLGNEDHRRTLINGINSSK